uniref:LAGLIDADG endonuclease n=1 Tax=Coniophora puteana TaxID=80637 RepID=A0A896YSW9_9AGAM
MHFLLRIMTNFNFTNDWLAGFIEADGSFVVSFEDKANGIPVRPRPILNLTQSKVEYEMFKALQEYLGVGRVQTNRDNVTLVISSTKELVEVIIPILDKYTLQGNKFITYQIFRQVCLMMYNKEHLTLEGTLKILELAYFMNKDTSLRTEETKEVLLNKLRSKNSSLPTNYKPELPEARESSPMSLEFIRGLVEGDGSFNIGFRTDRRRISVNFTVVLELASISLLHELVKYFNCGNVYTLKSNAARYQVQNLDDFITKVLPILRDVKFNTIKQTHFEIFAQVCQHIHTNGYKTDKDLKFIVDLAWDMNNNAKRRRVTKDEYLDLFINTSPTPFGGCK